jgi:hypothetical protein
MAKRALDSHVGFPLNQVEKDENSSANQLLTAGHF